MSVIAWDGKTLAADRQAADGDLIYPACKIRKLASAVIVAIAGYMDTGVALIEWLEEGADPAKYPASQSDKEMWSQLFVLHSDGQLEHYRRTPTPEPIIAVPMAWGSGADIAMGAMAMGADARKAVEIASHHSASCGLGTDAFDVQPLALVETGD